MCRTRTGFRSRLFPRSYGMGSGECRFFRGFGISDHVDYAAPLANAEGGERSCVLPNEVRAHRAIAGGVADDTERAAFCAGDALHCPGEDGRARTRSGRGAYFPCKHFGSTARLSTGQLGHSLVAIGGGDVLSIFSPDLPGPKPGEA